MMIDTGLAYLQFLAFLTFAVGIIKYMIKNQLFFISIGMKHPKATKIEMVLVVAGLSLFVIIMIVRNIWFIE
ncbi:Uncharacterised protein [Moraxella lacunata]|uniref:Uncharacterized protein n=1 Tax=Moraxella lacunata TaxID=477 RepID=A0A378T6A1_MORLA|nr:hypothetical protein [Moraxella lacunata]STZ55413.1 Uncharacterised protein [Moraxella lacunata]